MTPDSRCSSGSRGASEPLADGLRLLTLLRLGERLDVRRRRSRRRARDRRENPTRRAHGRRAVRYEVAIRMPPLPNKPHGSRRRARRAEIVAANCGHSVVQREPLVQERVAAAQQLEQLRSSRKTLPTNSSSSRAKARPSPGCTRERTGSARCRDTADVEPLLRKLLTTPRARIAQHALDLASHAARVVGSPARPISAAPRRAS